MKHEVSFSLLTAVRTGPSNRRFVPSSRGETDWRRIELALLGALLWIGIPLQAQEAVVQDATSIVRRSISQDAQNYQRLENYTFTDHTIDRRLDKDGSVSSSATETSEVMMLAGRPYTRLIARDGQPLSEKDTRKEQEKMDKELDKRLKNPEKDRAKFEAEREEERRFLQEIPEAFELTLLGEERVDGLPVWKIAAEPRPDYEPRERRAGLLKKVRGIIWIDQADFQWVRAELDVIDTITWGLFIVRIQPGGRIEFAQTRVNDEVWLPSSVRVRANARVALIKMIRLEQDTVFQDYRKFQTESQFSVGEVEPSASDADTVAADSPNPR